MIEQQERAPADHAREVIRQSLRLGAPGLTEPAREAIVRSIMLKLEGNGLLGASDQPPAQSGKALTGKAGDAGAARTVLTEACKPWEHYTGEPPDDGSPLSGVFVAGMVYTERLLAKLLDVTHYEGGDGSEDFDADATMSLRNILTGAGLWDADENRAVKPAPDSTRTGQGEDAPGLLDQVSPEQAEAFERTARNLTNLYAPDGPPALRQGILVALLKAHVAARPEAPSDAGWVLVPAEPTEEMYAAGYDATRLSDGSPQFADAGFCLGHSGDIYRAMIAARPLPTPPSDPAPLWTGGGLIMAKQIGSILSGALWFALAAYSIWMIGGVYQMRVEVARLQLEASETLARAMALRKAIDDRDTECAEPSEPEEQKP